MSFAWALSKQALVRKALVRKQLSAHEATLIDRDLLTLPLPCEPPWRSEAPTLQAVLKYNHSVYDALYCALAIEHRCDFVTADRLANQLQGVFPFMVHLSAIKP
jgi:predicted nucleic acid-binding protein